MNKADGFKIYQIKGMCAFVSLSLHAAYHNCYCYNCIICKNK